VETGKPDDRQRKLASRLLARHCCAKAFDLRLDAVDMRRTKGGKPFCGNKSPYPCFTFNVSHEGNYVVLAAESDCVVGVDVSAPENLRPGWTGKSKGAQDLAKKGLKESFGREEWARVEASPEPYLAFQQHWACKEAYSKAIGIGVQLDFSTATFGIQARGDRFAVTAPDGWAIDVAPLRDHWVCVARGPVSAVVDKNGDFKATLKRSARFAEALGAQPPAFEKVDVAALLPQETCTVRVHHALTNEERDVEVAKHGCVSDLRAAVSAQLAGTGDVKLGCGERLLPDDVPIASLGGEVVTLVGRNWAGAGSRKDIVAKGKGGKGAEKPPASAPPAAAPPPPELVTIKLVHIFTSEEREVSVPLDGTLVDIRKATEPLLKKKVGSASLVFGVGEARLSDSTPVKQVKGSVLCVAGPPFADLSVRGG
jgi:4'-phosphopantetheinyl transferase